MHLQKKVHGGERGGKRGWWLKPFLLIAPLSSFFKKIRNSTSRKGIILALFIVVPEVAPGFIFKYA